MLSRKYSIVCNQFKYFFSCTMCVRQNVLKIIEIVLNEQRLTPKLIIIIIMNNLLFENLEYDHQESHFISTSEILK